MTSGLLIVDVQTDFCEGGALGVEGGNDVAVFTAQLLMNRPGRYTHVYASQDWHNPLPDLNGGHFAQPGNAPNFQDTWPVHCVAGTPGAEIHPVLAGTLGYGLGSSTHLAYVKKGQGRPDYSAFQGVTDADGPLAEDFTVEEVTSLDICGIATDHCVLQSARDALSLLHAFHGLREVRVITDLCAGVDARASHEALTELEALGVQLTQVRYL